MSEDPRLAFDPEAVVCSEKVAIAAPAQKVWDVLVDFDGYSQWNPFCVEARGNLALGEPLAMRLKNYLVPGEYFDNVETICEIDAPRCVAWSAPWLDAWPYPARRDQNIETNEQGGCIYYSTDAFLGPYGIHVMRFAGHWVKRAFDDTAYALKAFVEAQNPAS